MNKIAIVGSPGSGKSFLSKRLSSLLELPLIHLDMEYWHEGWVETPREEWNKKLKDFTSMDKWIIDGNYNSSLELRMKEADAVIFLDIPRVKCVYRVIRRRGKKRSDLPDCLEEKFDKDFLDFLKYIWKFTKKDRARILELSKECENGKFKVLKGKKDIEEFIRGLR